MSTLSRRAVLIRPCEQRGASMTGLSTYTAKVAAYIRSVSYYLKRREYIEKKPASMYLSPRAGCSEEVTPSVYGEM